MWRHVIISTYGSWLQGDARGFRTRNHKIHSSGDYRTPPPPDEHEGLRIYQQTRDHERIVLPVELKSIVGEAIRVKLQKLGYRLNAISVAPTHSHWLAELPCEKNEAWDVVGQGKSAASLAVRKQLPGGIWAGKGRMIGLPTRTRMLSAYRYILEQDDSWIWSVAMDGEPQ